MILLEKINGWTHNGPMGNNLYQGYGHSSQSYYDRMQTPEYQEYYSDQSSPPSTSPPGDTGDPSGYTSPGGSMLDWLLPTSLKYDIGSLGYTSSEMGEERYEKLFKRGEQYKATRYLYPDAYNDWVQRVEDAGFGEFIDQETGVLKPFEEVDPGEFATASSGKYSTGQINPFDPESIARGVTGIGPEYKRGDIAFDPEKMIRPLTAGGLRKLHTGYYSDYLGQRRDPLEKQLSSKLALASGAGGGLAGYGRRQELGDIAKGSFMEKVGDIYADIDKQRGAATQDIYNIMQSWEDLSEAYTG